MMWVRYPNGQVVRYNTANYLSYKNGVWELYTRKEGTWVCSIQDSAGVVVEAVKACHVENPIAGINHDTVTNYVIEHIRELPCNKLHELKNLLKSFDSRTLTWKK